MGKNDDGGDGHGLFPDLCEADPQAVQRAWHCHQPSGSDVKQSTLDNIVRGLTKNPRVKTLHKIALAFNMTLAEFLDFDELNDYAFDEDPEEE